MGISLLMWLVAGTSFKKILFRGKKHNIHLNREIFRNVKGLSLFN